MKNKEQFKQLKQLAKEAYNSKEVSQEWKDKILEAYPEVKPKMEAGKWYSGYNDYVVFITEIKKADTYNKICYYGFSYQWFENDYIASNYIESQLRPATEEEVKEALIRELKKRGLKEGCGIISVEKNKGIEYKKEYELYYSLEYNTSWIIVPGIIDRVDLFIDGKWAEIIQDPEEIEVEHEEVKPNILELNGKKYKLIPID